MDWLLDHGANLKFPQNELRTDLEKGERDDTCGGLVQLSNFTHTGRDGLPLRLAVYHHNLPTIESLFYNGIEASAALLVAVERDDLDALKLLLGAGADTADACRIATTRSKIDAALACLEHSADPSPALTRDAELTEAESTYKPMDSAMEALLNEPTYRSNLNR